MRKTDRKTEKLTKSEARCPLVARFEARLLATSGKLNQSSSAVRQETYPVLSEPWFESPLPYTVDSRYFEVEGTR